LAQVTFSWIANITQMAARINEFWVGQCLEVVGYGFATVTCIAHGRFGCCGYVRYCGKIGVTYYDGTKYHCDREQLRVVSEECQQDEEELNHPLRHHVHAHAHEPFTVVALAVNGQVYRFSHVKAVLTLLELKQRISKQVNETLALSGRGGKFACCAKKLMLFEGEQVLHGDQQTLMQLGLCGPEVCLTFVQCDLDRCGRNLLLRDLLVAISRGRLHEAQALVNDVIDTNGTAHLAHLLKVAYLGRQIAITYFLLENCPAEVLFQALSMTTRPGYRPYHTIFRWINRETLFQHMAMTYSQHFLEIIYRRLSGRWMSKLQLAEARFRGELSAEADWVRRRVGDEHLSVWARGRSTNPEYVLRQLRESSCPSGISNASCELQDALEDDFVIGAKEVRSAKRWNGRFLCGTKTRSKRMGPSCTAQLFPCHRPRQRQKFTKAQITIERHRKLWHSE